MQSQIELSSKLLINKSKKLKNVIVNENSSDEENLDLILTKDRVLELQTQDSNGIKDFIN